MKKNVIDDVTFLEERHIVGILVHLTTYGPSRKIDIYDHVSSNPRMPDKLNFLEDNGLITQELDMVSRSTIVNLTPMGERVGDMLLGIDKIVKAKTSSRSP